MTNLLHVGLDQDNVVQVHQHEIPSTAKFERKGDVMLLTNETAVPAFAEQLRQQSRDKVKTKITEPALA